MVINIEMSEVCDMADGDSLNEVNSDREIDANAADADIDDDDVIGSRCQSCCYVQKSISPNPCLGCIHNPRT